MAIGFLAFYREDIDANLNGRQKMDISFIASTITPGSAGHHISEPLPVQQLHRDL
jgi:hypothetical protein